MKLKKIFALLLVSAGITSSCEDVEPAIPYDTFNFAAYLRTIQTVSGSYDVFNLASSQWTIIIEEVDEKDGALLESVEVYVTFKDNTSGNGTITRPEALIRTLSASDFAEDETSGLPRHTLTVTAQEAVTAVGGGMTLADVQGKDSFEFRLVLELTNGKTFTNNQSSGDVSGGSFYKSPFFYRCDVVCPLDPLTFVGSYLYEPVIDGPYGPTYGDAKLVTLELVSGSTTQRRIVGLVYLEHLGIGNASQNISLQMLCGDVVFPSYGANLSCGAGSIGMGPAQPANRTTYDLADDSVFEVGLTEFVVDGGCGEPPAQVRFRLTKQ